MASQAGHAFLEAWRIASNMSPDIAEAYIVDPPGTKVVLGSPSLEHLLRARDEAVAMGLPCALIVDSGHIMPPHFDGSDIITALGIGPARRHEARSITKRFSSL